MRPRGGGADIVSDCAEEKLKANHRVRDWLIVDFAATVNRKLKIVEGIIEIIMFLIN